MLPRFQGQQGVSAGAVPCPSSAAGWLEASMLLAVGGFCSSSERLERHPDLHSLTCSLCGGLEKGNAFWEAGGRVMGWVTCEKWG